ncbi:thioredoxin SoxW [Roseobacter sp. AzwK-3b]|uniref:thioredoxin family protein n=1 Tax=Roseobacter sp. AzwK-3b TaxID=351016 RepID=UPI000156AEF8|nr:thioredoxin family protein [Roseobacter sp. AzwK-3b]EDM69501.1 thioredoxin SoxW [Roseobacter sp. AzwK-3b]
MKHYALALVLALSGLAAPASAAEVGDDGLHKAAWMRDTFLYLRDDLEEVTAEGKRMAVMIEQRGCIYCKKMHEEVYPGPEISDYVSENYVVVQLNLHGDREVTDFDGESLSEKDMLRKWGILFTPTVIFLPEEVPEGASAKDAAVAIMPGAFQKGTTLDMYTWVNEKRYAFENEEDFQRYHARRIQERASGQN